jgi:Fe2+ or Zn2+ uptake regulation protein
MTSRASEDEKLQQQIVDDLLVYLTQNPKAADILEGITQWWLPQHEGLSHDDVLRALETLVAGGQVERCNLADGHCLYCRSRHAV